MVRKTLLGVVAAATVGAMGMFGDVSRAEAGVNFNIVVPGVYVGPPRYYWGGPWYRGAYVGGVYRPRYYHYKTGRYHCRRWIDRHGRKKHKCW